MRACVLLSVSLGVLLASAPATASPDLPRTEVPIRAVVLPDGVRRYAVDLTIDGQAVAAQLDTGSTGLRVLRIGLPAAAAAERGTSVHYSYGSGVQLDGVKVPASVGFVGGPALAVPIQRVDAVQCVERRPDCSATRMAPADYRIGGDGLAGQGFVAIIGTGLHDDTVPNPLIAMGVHRWIVQLPRTGESEGRLILNPGAEELRAFHRYAVLGNSNQIAACIVRSDVPDRRLCGPAMVDTGASGLRIQGGRPGDIWPNGVPAAIVLGDGSGVASFPVVIGRRDQASGMFATPARAGSSGMTLNLGLAPFFHWSVLFDADAHEIGVSER